MHVARTRARPRPRRRALPAEVHLPRHLLALRQRPAAADRGAAHGLPLVPAGRGGPGAALRRATPTPRRSSRCSTTTTCCCSGTACSPTRPAAPACASASTTCSSTSTRTPTRCRPTSSRCCGRTAPASPASATTRRPSTASAPPRCATSSTSSSASPAPTSRTLTQNYRSTAPILAATNALIAEATERRDKELWTDAGRRRPPGPRHLPRRGRADAVALRAHPRRTASRARSSSSRPCSSAPSTTPWRSRWSSRAATSPSTSTAACASSRWRTSRTSCRFLRLAENPRDAMAGLRVLGLVPGIGPKTAAALLESLGAAAGDFPAAWAGAARPRAGARRLAGRRRAASRTLARRRPGDVPAQVHAVRSVYGPLLERRYDNVQARLRDLEQIEGARGALADALAVPRRAGARPAGVHAGARRPAAARRGLPHPLHHALGQGPRVRRRLRHPRRRRQHPVRHGHRQRRRDRGGAAAVLRRLHARPRAALRQPPAALLHAAVGQGRHARLRAALALPHAMRSSPTSRRSRRGPRGRRPTRARSIASPPPPSAPACARSGRRRHTA